MNCKMIFTQLMSKGVLDDQNRLTLYTENLKFCLISHYGFNLSTFSDLFHIKVLNLYTSNANVKI
jgi:hypothetical protein